MVSRLTGAKPDAVCIRLLAPATGCLPGLFPVRDIRQVVPRADDPSERSEGQYIRPFCLGLYFSHLGEEVFHIAAGLGLSEKLLYIILKKAVRVHGAPV